MVRGQDQRGLATVQLGRLIDAIDGETRQAVKAVRVEHQRNVELQQARDHLHAAGGRGDAGAAQHAVVLARDLTDNRARSHAKGAARVGRNRDNGHGGQRHADEVRAGIGSCHGNVARTGARGGLSGHHRRTGIGGRAGNNEHRAAGVLVHRRGQGLHAVEKVCRLNDLRRVFDIVDNLVEFVVERAALNLARILRAVAAVQADLRRDHGRGLVGTDAAVGDLAGLGVQAGRNIGSDHHRRELVDRGDPDGERRAHLAVKAGAKDGVDHDVGLLDQLDQFIARRAHDHVDVTRGGPACHMARQGAGDLIRVNGRRHIDGHALVLQDICRHPAVTAVVAKAAQHKHALRTLLGHKRGQKLAGMLHELCF